MLLVVVLQVEDGRVALDVEEVPLVALVVLEVGHGVKTRQPEQENGSALGSSESSFHVELLGQHLQVLRTRRCCCSQFPTPVFVTSKCPALRRMPQQVVLVQTLSGCLDALDARQVHPEEVRNDLPHVAVRVDVDRSLAPKDRSSIVTMMGSQAARSVTGFW